MSSAFHLVGGDALQTYPKIVGKRLSKLLIASVGIAVAGAIFIYTQLGTNLLSMYLVWATGLLIAEAYAFLTFFRRPKDSVFGNTTPKKLAVLLTIDLGISVLIEFLTILGTKTGSVLSVASWQPKRMAIVLAALVVLTMLATEYLPVKDDANGVNNVDNVRPSRLSKKGKVQLRHAAPYVIAAAVVALLICIIPANVSAASRAILVVFVEISLGALAYNACSPAFRPERIFIAIAFGTGLAIMAAFPVSNLFSWDDEVHYSNAVSLSYIADVETTASDRMIVELFHSEPGISHDASFSRWKPEGNVDYERQWNQEEVYGYLSELNEANTVSTVGKTDGVSRIVTQFCSFAYIPSAFGLWLGRLLHLSFTACFVLGRFMNLAFYVAVFSLAIRIIPVKKTLMGVVGLLPTNLFLAANYSYDFWLTSLLALGVAMLIRELLDGTPLTTSRCFALFFVFFMALAPKAVYFPLLALLLLIPRSKFVSDRQRKLFYLTGVLVALLAVATFALPLFETGGGSGDARGGSDVNSSAQVSYILADPAGAAYVICRYMAKEYLAVANIDLSLMNWSYLGSLQGLYPFTTGAPLLLLVMVSMTDGTARAGFPSSISARVWTLFLVGITVFLSCTALYISFTAVGSPTVAGMQPRYLLPFVVPVSAIVLNVSFEKRPSERVYCSVVFGLASLLVAAQMVLLLLLRIH